MNAYRCFLPAVLALSVTGGFTAASQAAGAYGELRGKSQSAVEARYGAPDSVAGPVGDPPITRWFYDEFTVVFEYDHVVDAFQRQPELENLPPSAHPDRPRGASNSGDVLTVPE
jgi:hypothetical protein